MASRHPATQTPQDFDRGDAECWRLPGGRQSRRHQNEQAVPQAPILGQIPLLGAPFSDERNKTTTKDLLVIVTPELVEPGMTEPPLPTDHQLKPMTPYNTSTSPER